MLLFNIKKVKKFFDILSKLERHSVERYKGYNSKNPDWTPCSKEVFVNRTINKWFSGKSLIYFAEDKDTGIEFRRYITVNKLMFRYDWSISNLIIYLFDYSQPQKYIIEEKLTFNDIISCEGVWCINNDEHKSLLSKIVINEPVKEYKFKTYISQKRGKPKEGIILVQAQTLTEAYKQRKKLIEEHKGKILIGDIIEHN